MDESISQLLVYPSFSRESACPEPGCNGTALGKWYLTTRKRDEAGRVLVGTVRLYRCQKCGDIFSVAKDSVSFFQSLRTERDLLHQIRDPNARFWLN